MAYSIGRCERACLVLLFAVTTIAILGVYNANGVGSDFLSRYLNARTLSTTFFSDIGRLNSRSPAAVSLFGVEHTYMVQPALAVGDNFYFDDVWDPLPQFIMVPFILLFSADALAVYLVFLILLLFLSCYSTAMRLGLSPLLLSSIIIAPFTVKYTVLYNGGEILAMALALIAVGFAARRDYKAGIFMGLAGLAKYSALVLTPILLLLGERKSILKAIAVDLIATAPWLAFNLLIYGDPFQSYLNQIAEVQPQGGIGFSQTVLSAAWYPLLLVVVPAILFVYTKRKRIVQSLTMSRMRKTLFASQRNRITAAFLFLSFIGFVAVYNNAQGSIRLGYLLYSGVSVAAALSLGSAAMMKIRFGIGKMVPYLAFFLTFAMLGLLYLGWSGINFDVLGSLGSRSPEFLSAATVLHGGNLSDCSVVSNAWPYLDFYNITAYSPYLCNSTVARMPIVIFRNEGVPIYCGGGIGDMGGIGESFNYTNFSIYLPHDYVCVR